MTQHDMRIGRCRKFDKMTCPYMKRPEMKKARRLFLHEAPRDFAGGFDPTACFGDLKKANDRFCIGCSEFEGLFGS